MWSVVLAVALAGLGMLLASTPGSMRRLHALRPRQPPSPRARAARSPGPLEVAGDIDLWAACTRSGASPAVAADIVADCAGESTAGVWRQIAALTRLGVPVDRVRAHAGGVQGLRELAIVVSTSSSSGARAAGAAARIAATLRQKSIDAATARAERAGVFIAMPLTLCFLPAFLCLGLVPVVIGVASDVFATL